MARSTSLCPREIIESQVITLVRRHGLKKKGGFFSGKNATKTRFWGVFSSTTQSAAKSQQLQPTNQQVQPVRFDDLGVDPKIWENPPNHPFVHRVWNLPLFSPSILGGVFHPYFLFHHHVHLLRSQTGGSENPDTSRSNSGASKG